MRSMRKASRNISAAFHLNLGFISSGLPWLSRRGSTFIWGVWHDAKYLADHIATQRGYMAYNGVQIAQPNLEGPDRK